MSESHHDGEHHGPSVTTYFVIFAALAVFTIVSFVANGLTPKIISPQVSFTIILGVAVIKSTLVGMYFMHLKFDWSRVGFMIIPAFILAAMMMFVLLPDIVLAWR